MASSNAAAWLTAAKANPLEVKPASMWTPEDDEILVRNHAIAINPVDVSLQTLAWWPMNYPTILGQDIAGKVIAVGPNVTRFKEGDRVLGHAMGMATKCAENGAFQLHTILQTNVASELPDNISFQEAAVIPLACSTAASGLFQDEYLSLQFPTEPRQAPTGQTLLIWGGSSSVGSNAIQLAAAAGYEVITVASSKNFEYVKSLGASQVFDYNSPNIEDDLLVAFKGRTIAGALDCIGGAAWSICTNIVNKTDGKKFVATTKRGFPDPVEGVIMKAVFGTTIKDNRVGKAIYEDFLPRALAAASFVPSPEPMVAGQGLEAIQSAMNIYSKGVSAKKVVIIL